jgi:hypothetical protein
MIPCGGTSQSAGFLMVFSACILLLLIIYSFISIQPLGRFLAGTRAQSGDRYGSDKLHHGQVLRGRVPLLSTTFRHSHFRHQMPPRPQWRERSWQWKVELWARMVSSNFTKMTTSMPFRGLLHAVILRHWTDGFYFPSEGRCAEDFFACKNPTASARFKPANLGTKGHHRSRYFYWYHDIH